MAAGDLLGIANMAVEQGDDAHHREQAAQVLVQVRGVHRVDEQAAPLHREGRRGPLERLRLIGDPAEAALVVERVDPHRPAP